MDLFEYQARDLFERHGLPVLPGQVATTSEEAVTAATALVGEHGQVVVKAQVKTGGRGKAGGVKLATGSAEVVTVAQAILGMDIKGHTVNKVMICPTAHILEEYYFSLLLDRANRTFLAMASTEGGMDIEQVADTHPEALAKVPIDPRQGLDNALAHTIVAQAHFPQDVANEIAQLLPHLWDVFSAEDATLLEINPLAKVKTSDGQVRVMALDGKITLDDNAMFRHAGHASLVDRTGVDPLELRAKDRDLNYVKLDGSVGVIGNGAGLVMSTLDVVAKAGESFGGVRPANFLDIGGGASAQVMADGLAIILSDQSVRAILVNVFGGITACDEVARGVVQAVENLRSRAEFLNRPLVVRLDGNNAERGREILTTAALPFVEQVSTMDGAAARVAELAAA